MRRSLAPPVPELALAAKLLDAAGDAMLLGDTEMAMGLVSNADMSAIMGYAIRLVGAMSVEVHRQVRRPQALPVAERHSTRMPTMAAQESVFKRDGWRCRFCGVKVVSRDARAALIRAFPAQTHWVAREFDRHAALYAIAVSLDHVIPHSRGGTNEVENLVAACYCCQFGRGDLTLEEAELLDPRKFEPVVDSWDGLARVAHASLQPNPSVKGTSRKRAAPYVER